MQITNLTILTAKVTAEVELDSGEIQQLGLTITPEGLKALSSQLQANPNQAELAAQPVAYIEGDVANEDGENL